MFVKRKVQRSLPRAETECKVFVFSAGRPLAQTSPMGKVTFHMHCQDFYLKAQICEQTDASVHILSVPLPFTISLALSCSLSLSHKHTKCLVIIHTEKCPARTSLSCAPDSAGVAVMTAPAVLRPISSAPCERVAVSATRISDLKHLSTESIHFLAKNKEINSSPNELIKEVYLDCRMGILLETCLN